MEQHASKKFGKFRDLDGEGSRNYIFCGISFMDDPFKRHNFLSPFPYDLICNP